MSETKKQYELTVTKKPGSQVEISATIPADEWGSFRAKAVAHLNEEVSLDGFRKGKIPESVLTQKLGEFAILEEMAEMAIAQAYANIIQSEKLSPLGRPQVTVTKIAKGNPLEFRLESALFPTFTIPDHIAIAKKNETLEKEGVKDTEVEEAVKHILRLRAQKNPANTVEGAEPTPTTTTDIPELTDDVAKQLGPFQNAQEFRNALQREIEDGKEEAARNKRRGKILGALAKETTIDLPQVLVEGELDRMIEEFKVEVARAGASIDEYLTHAKKTIEEIRKEWKKGAESRVKTQLIIDAIAEKESLAPTDEEVKLEVARIMRAQPDANPESVEQYVRFMAKNRLTVEFLEAIADGTPEEKEKEKKQ